MERAAVLLRSVVLEDGKGAPLPLWSKDDALERIASDFPRCRDVESCVDAESLRGVLETYDDGSLTVSRMGGNAVEGTVNARQAGVMFLSVPFDDGWHLWVDEKPAEIRRVNLGFIGTDLSPGTHSFRMKYRSRGLRTGGLAGLAAAFGLAGVSVFLRIRRRRAQPAA